MNVYVTGNFPFCRRLESLESMRNRDGNILLRRFEPFEYAA